MSDIERIESGPRVSHAVIHNGVVYVGGVLSSGATVREQTQNVLQGIDFTLQRAGTDKSKLLSATVWLADIATFEEMNRVWDAWVPAGNAPARACIEAKLIKPGYRVEISVIAAV